MFYAPSYLAQDLLHKRLGGLGLVSVAGHSPIAIDSYPHVMQPPIMVGHGPEKHYVDPGCDHEITWAQRIFTNLTWFSNCEILATFRQKLLKQKK